MKAFKKFLAAALALTMLLTLCACGDKDSNKNSDSSPNTSTTSKNDSTHNSTTASYEVKVLDGQGNPMTDGVVVKFMKDGQQVAMQKPNNEGIAIKELEKGDYTVELMFTDSNKSGHYNTDKAVLSANQTTLELSLTNKLNTDSAEELTANDKIYVAYMVSAGSTYVPVKASERNYFLFAPTEAGTYKLSVDNNEIKLGYYGSQYFVQSQSALDVINNTVTLSVSDSSLGGTYVIGLDGISSDTDATLSIIRTGDPEITISDMPWTEYKTTHTPAPYTLSLPSGKSLKYIDTTGKTEDNKLVYNEADGYYHYRTADGPIVLVHLGKKAPFFSLQTVIQGDGLGGGAPIHEYFFDADGNFLKKEDYTGILNTYFDNMDKTHGVYPLNDDLIYIIQNGCKQWWDKNDPDYNEQFSITGCTPEIGWMFALCYVG